MRLWAFAIGFALCMITIRLFVGGISIVQGESMQPTLHPNELLLFSKINKATSNDIIIAKLPENQQNIHIIKRVIAVSGDSVEVVGDVVYVNNKPIDEPYITKGNVLSMSKIMVPPNTVFVLGDNRPNSMDSRDERIGFIPTESIVGVVVK